MIMRPVNLGVGVPGGEAMGGAPGITETEDRQVTALGEGQKSECASGEAGSRGGLEKITELTAPNGRL
jgi:hypothetical protein